MKIESPIPARTHLKNAKNQNTKQHLIKMTKCANLFVEHLYMLRFC